MTVLGVAHKTKNPATLKKDCFPLKFGGFNKCIGCNREKECERQHKLLVEGYEASAIDDLKIAKEFECTLNDSF